MIYELQTIYCYNDQPATCPFCYTRTEEIASFYHTNARRTIEQCLNEACRFVIVMGEWEE